MIPVEIKAVMRGFPHELQLSSSPEGLCQVGFSHDGMSIYDPRMSSCGRFDVGPEEYELTDPQRLAFLALGTLLDRVAEDTLNFLAKGVQDGIGIDTGDFAGAFFSDDEPKNGLRKVIAEYIVAEVNFARTEQIQQPAPQSRPQQFPGS